MGTQHDTGFTDWKENYTVVAKQQLGSYDTRGAGHMGQKVWKMNKDRKEIKS